MPSGNLSSGMSRLDDALKALEAAWLDVSSRWSDANSHHFSEAHLEPLRPQIKTALDAARRMAEVLAKANRACE